LVAEDMTVQKSKPKKPRRLPAPGGGRAIGHRARFIIEHGTPVPEFLKRMVVKEKGHTS
jgi:hypothetical protein